MTLYKYFPSKNDLILAVLQERDQVFRASLMAYVEQHLTLVDKIKAVFVWHQEWFNREDFSGCLFINAAAEFHDHKAAIHQLAAQHKQLIIAYLETLLVEAYPASAQPLALQLSLLLDGAIVAAQVSGHSHAAMVAWEVAEQLIDKESTMQTQLRALLAHYTPADATEQRHKADTEAFLAATPACTSRSTLQGHVTASAWILSPAGDAALLTHHKKLNRWLQLGGHVDDDDASIQAAALREAEEESGLQGLRLLDTALFDLDVHPIPAKAAEPAHIHYDFRFLMQAASDVFTVSAESHNLAWIALADLAQQLDPIEQAGLLRMVKKAQAMPLVSECY
jgi:8-oxo-dGTP pyrophosphatase MutT (NUDIX family)